MTDSAGAVSLYPAWLMFGIGLYAISAAIGELRRPGFWGAMVDNIVEQPALRFLTGLVCLAIGMAFYLVGPWSADDWMVLLVKVLGAWITIEGVLFLAIGDVFIAFSREIMDKSARGWAIFSLILGIAALIAAVTRLHGLSG